ncbi:MAG: putative pilN [Parcubacteria group bacterium]|nr:putative pilN [Parcubacteria group bacterium]
MALSPGIPTSFVPRQPVQPSAKHPMRGSNNIFLIVSVVILGIVVLMAVGVFAYDKYLTNSLQTKADQLATAQKRVDQNTIEEFVRLRDRLNTGTDLLTNHIVLSQFLDTLESLTLQNVRFNSMKLAVAGDHTAKIDILGTAKTFNALAAQSNAFAGEKLIKRAIFANITLSQSKLVTFRLTADIDPRLVVAGTGTGAKPTVDPLTLPVQTPVAPVATATPNLPTQSPATQAPAATTSAKTSTSTPTL